MAVLTQIRSKAWLLVAVIGIALVAFLLNDIPSYFSKGSSDVLDTNTVGQIDGESISVQEYESLAAQVEQQYSQSQQPYSAEDIHSAAWKALIAQSRLMDLVRKADLGYDQLELVRGLTQQSGIGDNPEFKENAMFSLTKFLDQLDVWDASPDEQKKQTAKQLRLTYKAMEDQLMYRKYIEGLSLGLLANEQEIKYMSAMTQTATKVEYVAYTPVKEAREEAENVNDSDIQDLINQRPLGSQTEANVDLIYATFRAKPSASDETEALANIQKYTNGGVIFNQVQNSMDTIRSFALATNDSDYLAAYSDVPFNDEYTPLDPQSINPIMLSVVNGLSVGSTSAPYKVGDAYVITKLKAKTQIADSVNFNVMIVQMSQSRTPEMVQSLADSIANALNGNPAQYDALYQLTDNQDPKSQGHVGWMDLSNAQTRGQFTPEMVDYFRSAAVNSAKSFNLGQAVAIISINDKKGFKSAVKMANLIKYIKPSEATLSVLSKKAQKFNDAVKDGDAHEFINIARQQNVEYYIQDNVISMAQLNMPQDANLKVLEWALIKDSDVGDLFNAVSKDNDQFVVYLKGKFSAGIINGQSNRAALAYAIGLKNAAEKLAEKNSKVTNLNTLATQFKTKVDSATVMFQSNPYMGMGSALDALPKTVGSIMMAPVGKVKLVANDTNVVGYRVISRTNSARPLSKQEIKMQLKQAIQSNAYQLMNAFQGSQVDHIYQDVEDKRLDIRLAKLKELE